MRLKSIEIQGFKSFADRTVLRFGEGITAVVGPNGSGKSNISDAVRWVLGEQSNKTLRSNKMEDVVFGGTASRKRLGFAEVTLVIDNTERQLAMDTDEVSVTRRYYRSGESEYRLNNASVRLKDIHELFMDTGLGRDGYSMVGQGRIDDIVGTKTSTERREIFEEAAGISRFRYRKTEAERKLKSAEDNLVRLRDILGELESRVGPLKTQSEKAVRYLALAKEQENLQIGLWLHTLSNYKESLREQEHRIADARAQYDEIQSRITDLGDRIDVSGDELIRLSAESEQAREEATKWDERAASSDAEIAVKTTTIQLNEETVRRLRSEMEEAVSGASTISSDIEAKERDIAAKTLEIESIRDQLDQANDTLLHLISDSESFSSQIEAINAALGALTLQGADARVAMMAADTAIEEIHERTVVLDQAISQKQKIISDAAREREALAHDLDAAQETVDSCSNSLAGRQLLLDSRREKLDGLKKRIDAMLLDEGEKRRRAQILKDLESHLEGFGAAVKSVVQASHNGKLSGIHGPVSHIISVENKYAAAVECALGAAMQHIVVTRESDAKRAIQYLKSNQLGRATFLPLESMKPRSFKEAGVDKKAGFVAMAVDLVQADAKYSNVLSGLLGGIVVAEDIDAASSIGKAYAYRFKVVTLDGQVVNPGGSLTGGSLSKNAGILSRRGDIEKLLAKADELKGAAAKLNEEYEESRSQLDTMEAEIRIAQSAITTAQEDKIRILGEIKRVEEQIATAQGDLDRFAAEAGELKSRLAERRSEKESAQTHLEEVRLQSEEKQNELDRLSGGRDESFAIRKDWEDKINVFKTSIFEKERDIDVIRSSIHELNSFISGQADRRERMRSEIEALTHQNAEISSQIESLNQQAESYRRNAAQVRDSVSDLLRKRDELDQGVQAMRTEERNLSADREKINGELVRLEERKIAMVHKYDDTIQKLYDEYGLTRSEAEEKGTIPEDIPAAQRRLAELSGKIRALGTVNVAAIEEYKEVSERYEFLCAQVKDIEESRDQLNRLIEDLTKQMKSTFLDRFRAINVGFSEVFTSLFGGGSAELRLSDPENTLESGIEILAQPPGKNVSIIEQLSGGEKALIAISIYFAVMKVNPPPFCVLDEVDAALDDVNVNRFAEYLRRMSAATQFIVITHRRGSMEEADMLYGVTMQEKGVSKLLELNVSELESRMKLKVEP